MSFTAASKTSFARSTRTLSPPVLSLLFLHLLFLLENVAENYKFFTLWFSNPSARIQLFPIHSPTNELSCLVYSVCLLGLASAKPWGWWLALVLDIYGILPYLFGWQYLFIRPYAAVDARIFLYILDAVLNPVAVALLFFPGVAGHFSVDRLLARNPSVQNVLTSIPFPTADKIITRIIALGQLLLCLDILAVIWVYFPWSLYPVLGAVIAGFLFTAKVSARITCICWQVLFVVFFIFWWVSHPNLNSLQNSANRAQAYAAAYLVLAALYLTISIFYLRYSPPRGHVQAERPTVS